MSATLCYSLPSYLARSGSVCPVCGRFFSSSGSVCSASCRNNGAYTSCCFGVRIGFNCGDCVHEYLLVHGLSHQAARLWVAACRRRWRGCSVAYVVRVVVKHSGKSSASNIPAVFHLPSDVPAVCL